MDGPDPKFAALPAATGLRCRSAYQPGWIRLAADHRDTQCTLRRDQRLDGPGTMIMQRFGRTGRRRGKTSPKTGFTRYYSSGDTKKLASDRSDRRRDTGAGDGI